MSAGQYFLHIDGTGWGDPSSSSPSGYSDYASLGQYSISGSIVDPGGLPTVSVGDVSASESAASVTFTLQLSAPAATTTRVDWITSDASATAGLDYVASNGTAVFLAGATSALVTIDLSDDSEFEGTESFVLNLQNPNGLLIGDRQGIGTIIDDDTPPPVSLSITDASANEGKLNTKGRNSGTPQLTNLSFVVSLSAASSQTISVDYRTVDDTARVSDSDYRATNGTLTFQPGQTSQTINVTILGDNTVEPDESFRVLLSNATQAGISDATGMGWILNDDSNSGGGGKRNGKSGKGSSDELPIAIADPFWFFEAHEHEHEEHDHAATGNPLRAENLTVDQQFLRSGASSWERFERELLTEDELTGLSAELFSLINQAATASATVELAIDHHNPPSSRPKLIDADPQELFDVDSFFASFADVALRNPT